ncbi:GNAT family N-acetyltransferase [Meridianimarinicoccus roseus]|uniref:GNAT family N-acetyltransferase n=1 Tax=Meridianimarinicoccus roseus TaxID=2072018 RepID=A0A2V2LIV2_9RHOB|nr:GNAT family N-acetyltransferase [Meridianimarinicoccus roseus]PWR03106.1 GNAT family N-acetyltransferase [Meridianimarinicoccus roseus]
MSVRVRPLAAGDRPDWDALWRGYLDFYQTTLPAAQFDLHFARLTGAHHPAWHGLVAMADERPVGIAHVLLHPHGWQAEDTAYLQDLFVAPEARGTGAGRALMLAVYDLADKLGARGVYWTTQHFNTKARTLYDRVGTLTPFLKYARA